MSRFIFQVTKELVPANESTTSSLSESTHQTRAFVLAPTPAQLGRAPGQLQRSRVYSPDAIPDSALTTVQGAVDGKMFSEDILANHNIDNSETQEADSSARMPPPSTPGKEKRLTRKSVEDSADRLVSCERYAVSDSNLGLQYPMLF